MIGMEAPGDGAKQIKRTWMVSERKRPRMSTGDGFPRASLEMQSSKEGLAKKIKNQEDKGRRGEPRRGCGQTEHSKRPVVE